MNQPIAAPVPLDQPDPEVIARLREAMEKAESGELRSFVLTGVVSGGDGFTTYVINDIFRVLAMLEIAKHNVLKMQEQGR
jgi:hypothetical protein